MNKLATKSSILSISLLTVMASAAISPALAKIHQAFVGTDPTMIKLVLTLPSLFIIPFSLLSGWLASRMKKKYVLLIGLIIYFLGGVGGGFARNIKELLIIRAFFGIGAGLIIPLSTSLIADFFEGEERTKMMGYSGSVSHFGGVIFLLLSGWLACMSWRYTFGVYALSFLIILMVLVWLPEPESKKAAGLLQKHQRSLKTYLLLTPPFLTEKESLQDCLRTAKDIAPFTDMISLNPCNVQRHTIVEYLWKRDQYRPPWLWTVVEFLKHSKTLLDAPVKCDVTGGGSRRGAHNCEKCDQTVLHQISDFSLSQKTSDIKDTDCDCKEQWKDQLDLEALSFGSLVDFSRWNP
jgi:hypothetical protein